MDLFFERMGEKEKEERDTVLRKIGTGQPEGHNWEKESDRKAGGTKGHKQKKEKDRK